MNIGATFTPNEASSYYTADACDLSAFRQCVERQTNEADAPAAEAITHNIPIYGQAATEQGLSAIETKRALMAEWAHVLLHGPGVLVLKQSGADHQTIDAASQIFETIIEEESAAGSGADHFAAAGANARIWNALQKLCVRAPELFARYHATPAIDAVCEAWLGPGYQMTAQVNLVRPGGKAQQAHRDYHLGFQTAEVSAQFPAHAHLLSPVLTLQGGIAHVDVPVDAGPTKLLPFSQTYAPGYAAWRKAEFSAYFEAHHVQLPLQKGDALFFNPALFHAGGENKTNDIQRLVNLVQVSSPFGRAMESMDRIAMAKALYPALLKASAKGDMTLPEQGAAIAACAEGYAFPTNLDTDPPAGGLAPLTHADIMRNCLRDGVDPVGFSTALDEAEFKRRA
ncbi:MAG: phytanoyl-CoA dioxygenase family protein [Pseudomonadota bacterium]